MRQESSAKSRIDPILKQAIDAKEVPGVVAMAATERGVLYEGAVGPRALEAGAASMTPDTPFRIASMTKAIATVAAMQLVEQGKLKLDDPVPRHEGQRIRDVLRATRAAGAAAHAPARRLARAPAARAGASTIG
jgi:CubicO group peptidase (beta-lactamase class C family)